MSPSIPLRLLRTQSDERLVALARQGHERAFEALVHRYRRPLLGYCRRLLLPEARAEDALQQSLLQAWVALRDGCEVRDAKAWLYRIVHNAAVSALRRSGYDYVELDDSLHGAAAPESDIDRRIAVREALAGLAALPEAQREVLLRTAVQGHSHERVAEELGLSDGAVRGLIYRARATLRAAATALTPPQMVLWAARGAESGAPLPGLVRAAGASGSAGLFGLLAKGSAVVVSAGVLATGATLVTHGGATSTATTNPPGGRTARSAPGLARPDLLSGAPAIHSLSPLSSTLPGAPRAGGAERPLRRGEGEAGDRSGADVDGAHSGPDSADGDPGRGGPGEGSRDGASSGGSDNGSSGGSGDRGETGSSSGGSASQASGGDTNGSGDGGGRINGGSRESGAEQSRSGDGSGGSAGSGGGSGGHDGSSGSGTADAQRATQTSDMAAGSSPRSDGGSSDGGGGTASGSSDGGDGSSLPESGH